MVAAFVVLVVTAVWLRALSWLYHRGVAHRAARASRNNVSGVVAVAAIPVQRNPRRDVAACLGVSSEAYERYVDRGLEDLDIFLADQPAV